MTTRRAGLFYAAAWLPAGTLWFVYAFRTRNDVGYAALAAAALMATLSLLGLGIWRLSGRLPWSGSRLGPFLVAHALYGLVFMGIVLVVDAALIAYHDRIPLLAALRRPGSLLSGDKWSFLTFYLIVSVYCLAVSICQWKRAQDSLHVRELAVMRAEFRAAREELRALRSQLNPHFLFNVLHSLSVLVRTDPVAAEAALDHLGAMLRYLLDDGAGDEVQLADEWTFVEHYLALESLRLGPRLKVERDVDEDALDAVIPPFTLQLLVENAIRHGVGRLPRGGTVFIGTRLQEDTLLIRVRDDGPGASADVLAAEGLGLRALRQRLLTRYDGRATLEVRSTPGAGFEATIHMPEEAERARLPPA
jgi:signal transduction histidine kinase